MVQKPRIDPASDQNVSLVDLPVGNSIREYQTLTNCRTDFGHGGGEKFVGRSRRCCQRPPTLLRTSVTHLKSCPLAVGLVGGREPAEVGHGLQVPYDDAWFHSRRSVTRRLGTKKDVMGIPN